MVFYLITALLVLGSDAAGLRRNAQQVTPTNNLVGRELSQAYRASIQEEGLLKHLEAFQDAADSSGGIRAAGTTGWVKSLQYVASQLTQAGYSVYYHEFLAPYYEELTPPELEILASEVSVEYTFPANTDMTFRTYKGSASGRVEGNLYAINVAFEDQDQDSNETFTSNSACELEDFEDFPAGGIALIQRGNCSYTQKVENAVQANASAVILFNDETGQNATINRFRTNFSPIPILFGSSALGRSFVDALEEGEVQVRIQTNLIGEDRINKNILAETTHGNPSRTLVVGAHLDSVFEGPGISDNGSGSSGVLELALQLKGNGYDNPTSLKNRIRFAWWAAEDIGVIGSHAYVDSLSQEEVDNMAMYINMDMIGSPNFVRFILDGDSSNSEFEPLPQAGSPMAHIEKTIHEYFDEVELPIEEEPFSNSYTYTDHTPFYDAGVPVTDLHTGIGLPKTEEQAAIFGGEAGEDWDPCYHKSCDTIDNVDVTVMEEMTRAAAHALAMYGSTEGDLFDFNLVDEGVEDVEKKTDRHGFD